MFEKKIFSNSLMNSFETDNVVPMINALVEEVD